MNKKTFLAFLILLTLIPSALAFNPIAWVKSFFVVSNPEIVKAELYPQRVLLGQMMTKG